MFPKPLHALAALSLVGASSAAVAQSTAPLSLANASGAATSADANDLHGTARWLVGAVVLGLIVWGIIELTDNDDEAFPVSP
jgi:hypothetical protein